MAEKNVAVFHNDQTSPDREETRSRHQYLPPAVDIYETDEALVLMADLPGLPGEAVAVHAENGILTIEGRAESPAAGEVLYREFSAVPYYRQFRIPDSVDPARAAADFKNGVLTLTLPRAEKAKPRRIEISPAA
jgi:HSP20 family molecular chaperone IbpA